jgi:hypothetical protein
MPEITCFVDDETFRRMQVAGEPYNVSVRTLAEKAIRDAVYGMGNKIRVTKRIDVISIGSDAGGGP